MEKISKEPIRKPNTKEEKEVTHESRKIQDPEKFGESPSQKMWSIIVKVVTTDEQFIGVSIPAFSKEPVQVSRLALPEDINTAVVVGTKLHCRCNVKAKTANDLMIDRWKIAK